MKRKLFINLFAATVLGMSGGVAGSFSFDFSVTGTSQQNIFRNRIQCRNRFAWSGADHLGCSFGFTCGCNDDDDFDFYYKSWGGYLKGTAHGDAYVYTPGENDETEDGPWFREGPWSVDDFYAGDMSNDGRRYDSNVEEYPAVAWGHPEADPFVSAGGEGDNLGGRSGFGIAGFGTGDYAKLKADDDEAFYPIALLDIRNQENDVIGSMEVDLSWHFRLYDKAGNEVYGKDLQKTFTYWETLNWQSDTYGIVCPRSSVGAGEIINDVAYNTDIHDNILSGWPIFGLDDNYTGDGGTDAISCADAAQPRGGLDMTDTFRVGHREYQISIDGPYRYDPSVEGCPATNIYGMPDTTEKWDAKCFKKITTVWADEGQTTEAFMRVRINRERKECGCHCGCQYRYEYRHHNGCEGDCDHNCSTSGEVECGCGCGSEVGSCDHNCSGECGMECDGECTHECNVECE